MRAPGFVAAGGCLALATVLASPAWAAPAGRDAPQVAPTKHSPRPKPSGGSKPPSAKPSPTGRPTGKPPQAESPTADCNPQRGYRGSIPASWAQERLAFERVWPLTRGGGVTVAVVDSGADVHHPMLDGRVASPDFVDLTGTGRRDCDGHGTGVAALIAGRDMAGHRVPLSGVAPDAHLVIVKQQNADQDDQGGDRLPRSIRAAVDAGARVVNVSVRVADTPELRQAVQYALAHDAVVVAAAGNTKKKNGDDGPAYPASYPGVLSVAALGRDGSRDENSNLGSRVDVAAPGKDVYTAWTGDGYNLQAGGTSFSAAFVSGVVTLVRARHPALTPQQVIHRVVATADGNVGTATGRGMVDPLQAVTAVLPEETSGGPAAKPPVPARFAPPAESDGHVRTIAVAVTGGTLGAAALAALAGVVVPMGRRRGWRPGWVGLPLRPEQEEPQDVGPDGGVIGSRDRDGALGGGECSGRRVP
ncbi:type VII secretion-associated serine protease mycosin [Actinomadura oligospora]|uniref:type VII secretion-associated serine protease mycosin n=1 Tax=Actinomadura oligospora TaxID=111804 RepID=UPI000685B142|nr:type VII secretion-associated serine protease mycosin [Actinomadura oligospora]